MIKYLWDLLFYSCRYQYEIYSVTGLFDPSRSSTIPVGRKLVLKCKHCGKIKSKKV